MKRLVSDFYLPSDSRVFPFSSDALLRDQNTPASQSPSTFVENKAAIRRGRGPGKSQALSPEMVMESALSG